jgi:hypothetical protein
VLLPLLLPLPLALAYHHPMVEEMRGSDLHPQQWQQWQQWINGRAASKAK